MLEINRDLEFCYEYLDIFDGTYPSQPVLLELTGTYVTINMAISDKYPPPTTYYYRGGDSELEHVLSLFITSNVKHK